MIPDFGPEEDKIPQGTEPLGDGYVLLRVKDDVAYYLNGNKNAAVKRYFEDTVGGIDPGWHACVARWA
jgi:hypothetical protein